MFVAATIESDRVKLYKNGSNIIDSNITWNGKTNGTPIIGTYEDGGYHIDGKQDDIRLYNRAFTQSEIQNIYDATRP
jgi:hypothetical protein